MTSRRWGAATPSRLRSRRHIALAARLAAAAGLGLLAAACAGGTTPKPKPGQLPKLKAERPPNPLIPLVEACERAADRARLHRRKLSFNDYVSAVNRLGRQCGIGRKTLRGELARLKRDRRVLRLMAVDDAPHLDEVASTSNLLAARRYRRRARRAPHPMQQFVERHMPYFVRKGVEVYRANETMLKKIASDEGVSEYYLLAIWGIETAYGANTGKFPVIRTLATLGHGHRVPRIRLYFTKELLAALILVDKDVAPEDWTGSHAGASGAPQFMPSDVVRYSASADGKVHADIWTTDKPADALTSIANFLRKKANWNPEHDRTMIEVRLPRRFNFDQANRFKDPRTAADFGRMGVRDAARKPIIYRWPEAAVYLPAGCRGPAFLTNKNFQALLVYNVSYPYALKVSLLAEAIRAEMDGETFALAGRWPSRAGTLSRRQIIRLQRRLKVLGYRGREGQNLLADGFLGSNTRAAVRRFQKRADICPDGYANQRLYNRLMRAAPKRRLLRRRRS